MQYKELWLVDQPTKKKKKRRKRNAATTRELNLRNAQRIKDNRYEKQ